MQEGGTGTEKWKIKRTADANTGALMQSATFVVDKGEQNRSAVFTCITAPTITLDTTALTFESITIDRCLGLGSESVEALTLNQMGILWRCTSEPQTVELPENATNGVSVSF